MFYPYRALVWTGKVGISGTIDSLECCTINISVADISWNVISLQLKGYSSTEWQFHVVHFLLHSQSHNLL
jgi:predicted transcriptional regulator